MKLKNIYKRAKRLNPFYKNSSFADFISDFGNYQEGFFLNLKEFKRFNTKKLSQEFYKFYKKYYK
mgnify:CR=1 FL=1